MRIGFLVHTFPSLSETFVRNQVTGLLDMGHSVTVYAKKNTDSSILELEDVRKYGLIDIVVDNRVYIPRSKFARLQGAIKIIWNHWRTNSRQILEALNIFNHGKDAANLLNLYTISPYFGPPIELMQCHFGHIADQAVFLKKMGFKFKMQVMFHGFDIRLGIEKGGEIYDGLIKYADKVQAISSYNMQNLVKFGFRPDQLIYHPVGIELNKFPKKTNYTLQGNTIKILSVGRLVWEKGFEYSIKAVSQLVQKGNTNLNYTIIGDGDLCEPLEELIKELKMENNIFLVGAKTQEEINRYYDINDIFLLPSIAEALPVVLMEAQCKGMPIIATDVGAIADLVKDDINGLLIEPANIDAIKKSILRMIAIKKEWPKMGLLGRDYIVKNHDINKLNELLLN